MTKSLAATAAVVLLLAPQIEAKTLSLSGDRGHGRVSVGNSELYDADGTFAVDVQQNIQGANTGLWINPGPSNATWRGGAVAGTGINRSVPWDYLYHKVEPGNGACVLIGNHQNFTLEHFFCAYPWDGVRWVDNSQNWLIKGSWIADVRDDAIENDHIYSGKVEKSYIEAAHSFYSATPGGGGASRPHRLEVVDNLISLGCQLDGKKPCEDRAKRLGYAWSRPVGNGQFFKVNGCGADIDILFKGNSVMMGASQAADGSWYEVGFNTAGANLSFFQCMNILPGSTGNSFYWLGGCDFKGLKMVQLHGACVPEMFKLDPAIFTLASNSRPEWEARVAKWQSEVWGGKAPPTDAGGDGDGGLSDIDTDGDGIPGRRRQLPGHSQLRVRRTSTATRSATSATTAVSCSRRR